MQSIFFLIRNSLKVMNKISKLSIALIFIASQGFTQTFTPLVETVKSSFRGIDTYGKAVVWVSGSNGTVGYSANHGNDWNWVNPKGYEKFDFRDIAVFSKKEAVIMSAGSPAIILHTTNAGKTWKKVYEDNRPDIFLDAMDFNGKLGYALGDPIDGQFQLLRSTDKGRSWQDVTHNFILFADEGEVAFAASGTNLKVWKDKVYIGTGGKYASFFNYNPKSLSVDKLDVPIWSGNESSGIFSIDFRNEKEGVAVGGDYLQDHDNRNNILLTYDGGSSWNRPETAVYGYRSSIIYITNEILVATGTSGTDLSKDGGRNWSNISSLSFNSLSKSSDGKHIYLTGSKGNVYKLAL